MMVSHMNLEAPDYQSASEFEHNSSHVVSARVTEGLTCGVECNPKLMKGLANAGINWVRTGPVEVEDQDKYDQARVQIALNDLNPNLAGRILGRVYISYTVKCIKMRMWSAVGRTHEEMHFEKQYAVKSLNAIGISNEIMSLTATSGTLALGVAPSATQVEGETSLDLPQFAHCDKDPSRQIPEFEYSSAVGSLVRLRPSKQVWAPNAGGGTGADLLFASNDSRTPEKFKFVFDKNATGLFKISLSAINQAAEWGAAATVAYTQANPGGNVSYSSQVSLDHTPLRFITALVLGGNVEVLGFVGDQSENWTANVATGTYGENAPFDRGGVDYFAGYGQTSNMDYAPTCKDGISVTTDVLNPTWEVDDATAVASGVPDKPCVNQYKVGVIQMTGSYGTTSPQQWYSAVPMSAQCEILVRVKNAVGNQENSVGFQVSVGSSLIGFGGMGLVPSSTVNPYPLANDKNYLHEKTDANGAVVLPKQYYSLAYSHYAHWTNRSMTVERVNDYESYNSPLEKGSTFPASNIECPILTVQ
jgi:hypothetical protein